MMMYSILKKVSALGLLFCLPICSMLNDVLPEELRLPLYDADGVEITAHMVKEALKSLGFGNIPRSGFAKLTLLTAAHRLQNALDLENLREELNLSDWSFLTGDILVRCVQPETRNDQKLVYLVEHGLSVDKPGLNGRTALYYAIVQNDPILVEQLLDIGADAGLRTQSYLISAINVRSPEIVLMLVSSGANPDRVISGMSAARYATFEYELAQEELGDDNEETQRLEYIKELLKRGMHRRRD